MEKDHFLPCCALPLIHSKRVDLGIGCITAILLMAHFFFLASTKAAVMDSSLHCFPYNLMHLWEQLWQQVYVALALHSPVFNFFLGITHIIHVYILKRFIITFHICDSVFIAVAMYIWLPSYHSVNTISIRRSYVQL